MYSDELDGNLNLSDCEDAARSFRAKTRAKKIAVNRTEQRHYKAQVDTNVSMIEFQTLKDQAEMATGDPYFCENCRSVFNMYSKVEEAEGGGQTWKCEFCMHENKVEIEEGEKPQTNDVKFILEAAA